MLTRFVPPPKKEGEQESPPAYENASDVMLFYPEKLASKKHSRVIRGDETGEMEVEFNEHWKANRVKLASPDHEFKLIYDLQARILSDPAIRLRSNFLQKFKLVDWSSSPFPPEYILNVYSMKMAIEWALRLGGEFRKQAIAYMDYSVLLHNEYVKSCALALCKARDEIEEFLSKGEASYFKTGEEESTILPTKDFANHYNRLALGAIEHGLIATVRSGYYPVVENQKCLEVVSNELTTIQNDRCKGVANFGINIRKPITLTSFGALAVTSFDIRWAIFTNTVPKTRVKYTDSAFSYIEFPEEKDLFYDGTVKKKFIQVWEYLGIMYLIDPNHCPNTLGEQKSFEEEWNRRPLPEHIEQDLKKGANVRFAADLFMMRGMRPNLTLRRSRETEYASEGCRISSRHLASAVIRDSTSNLFYYRRTLPNTKGGTVLIDASGSMSITSEDIIELVKLAPGATVAFYGGSRNLRTHPGLKKIKIPGYSGPKDPSQMEGSIIIASYEGKISKDVIRGIASALPNPGGGNEVDYDGLRWMVRQKSPWYLVSDMDFVGGVHGQSAAGLDLAYTLSRRRELKIIPSVHAAIDEFKKEIEKNKKRR